MARSKLAPRRVIAKSQHRQTVTTAVPNARATVALDEHPPTEIFTSTAGVRGELLRLGHLPPAQRGQTDPPSDEEVPVHTHVLLLPGNPGVVEYYRPMLRSLFRRFPKDVAERVTVHALGLPGHDLRELNGEAAYEIKDHIAYCRDYLESEEVWPSIQRSRLVVIGHSYGSYLGLRLIADMGAAVVQRSSVVLLMPAIYYMGRCAGIVPRFLAQDHGSMTTWIGWGLTAVLPPIMRDTLVWLQGHCTGVSDVSKKVIDGRRRGLYRNICSLARDEIRSILDPSNLTAAGQVGKRTMLLYADGDRWCPPEGRARIAEVFGNRLQVEWAGEGVEHAFVLSSDETERVVRIVAPWVSDGVRTGQ